MHQSSFTVNVSVSSTYRQQTELSAAHLYSDGDAELSGQRKNIHKQQDTYGRRVYHLHIDYSFHPLMHRSSILRIPAPGTVYGYSGMKNDTICIISQ